MCIRDRNQDDDEQDPRAVQAAKQVLQAHNR